MSAKLSAQESVISGLREERKLWGQELALQGATLAQDRGKMEGQIESLNRENKELRDRLDVSSLTFTSYPSLSEHGYVHVLVHIIYLYSTKPRIFFI